MDAIALVATAWILQILRGPLVSGLVVAVAAAISVLAVAGLVPGLSRHARP